MWVILLQFDPYSYTQESFALSLIHNQFGHEQSESVLRKFIYSGTETKQCESIFRNFNDCCSEAETMEVHKKVMSFFQVHEIPFPFTDAEQFEKSIRAPLGKTWNPLAVHNELVKPRVVTSLGKIIAPMHKSELSKYEKSKAQSDVEVKKNNETQKGKKEKHKGQHGKKLMSNSGKKNTERAKNFVKRLDKPTEGKVKNQQKKGQLKHVGKRKR